jgi:putative tricarboxylic transport membrane protein
MTPGEQALKSSGGFRRWTRILPEVIVLGLTVPMWTATSEWTSTVGGPGPAFYPRLLLALLALAMVVRIVQEVMSIRRGVLEEDAEAVHEEGVEIDTSLLDMRRVVVAVGLSVVYVVATLFIGWTLATFALVIVFLWLAGRRNLLITVPLALVFSLGMSYIFVKIVYISLPTGVGAFDQFTVLLFELLGVY